MPFGTMPPPSRGPAAPSEDGDDAPETPRARGFRRVRMGTGGGLSRVVPAFAWLAFAALGGLAAWRVVGWPAGVGVLAAVLAAGAWRGARARRRRRSAEPVAVPGAGRGGPRAAFRGLYPFEPGEPLPGERRAWAARTFADWLMRDEPTFWLLCAESGCGKTSMVRTELSARLEQAGWTVRYFNGRAPEDGGDAWSAVLEELDAVPPGAPTVFVLDQFEKFLAAEPRPEGRSAFGARLQGALARSPRLRVLCVIPASHMLPMAGLAPGLPDPTSKRSLMEIRRFSEEEARDIILECGHMDGLEIAPALASALAQDLAEDGSVRPTELQIVCTYLGRSFTEDRYRMAGGAGGILAEHVRAALSRVESEEVGARLLRAMCDFGSFTRAQPRTLAALTAEAAQSGGGADTRRAAVREQLRAFEDARIVRRDTSPDKPDKYELVHDYLVQAVATATSSEATRTEVANQQLRYLLRSGERGVSVLRAWRMFRHANADLKQQAANRRLWWRVLWIPAAAAIAGFVLLASLTVVTVDGWKRAPTWNSETVDQHPSADSKTVVVQPHVVANGRRVVTGDSENPSVVVWSSAGNRVRTFSRGGLRDVTADGALLLVQSFAVAVMPGPGRPVLLIHVQDRSVDSIPSAAPQWARFSGRVVTYFDTLSSTGRTPGRDLVVYSPVRRAPLGRVRLPAASFGASTDAEPDSFPVPFVTPAGDRLVLPVFEDERWIPALYDVRTGARLGVLGDADDLGNVFAVFDPDHRRAITVARDHTGGIRLRRWSLDTGEHLSADRPLDEATATRVGAVDSIRWLGAEHALLRIRGEGWVAVVDPRTAGVLLRFPTRPARRGDPTLVVDDDDSLTVVRDLAREDWQIVLATPHSKGDAITMRADRRRLVIQRANRTAELWDATARVRIAQLNTLDPVSSVTWSSDSAAVIVVQQGGLSSLFDAQDGSPIDLRLALESGFRASTFDRRCRRVTLWYRDGRVIRHTEGRKVLGTFWPTGRCRAR
jgi:hypothetical protein